MYKFTPGPWTHKGSLNIAPVQIVAPGDDIVAIVIGDSREGMDIAANVALISTAPDLLEALIYARNIIDNHVKITMQTKNAAEALAAMVAIDEAIDKALGRNPAQDLNDYDDSKDIKRGNNAAGREYIERKYDMADLERKRDKGE